MIITPRFLPGLRVGKNDFISLETTYYIRDGRRAFRYYISIGGKEYSGLDLNSACGDCRAGLENLLAFLEAAADSYDYHLRTGRPGLHEDLFPPAVVEWAYQHRDEILALRYEVSAVN